MSESGARIAIAVELQERFAFHVHEPRGYRVRSPSTSRLRVMRDGRNIIRSARIPKPVVLVDTRERKPFPLHVNHPELDWGAAGGAEDRGLHRDGHGGPPRAGTQEPGGPRAVHGDLSAAVPGCLRPARQVPVEGHPDRGDLRGHQRRVRAFWYSFRVHPNAVCGLVDAIEAKFGIPFIYASTMQDLATERAAKLALEAFHLLVAGAAGPRSGPIDSTTMIAVEGGLMRRCGLNSFAIQQPRVPGRRCLQMRETRQTSGRQAPAEFSMVKTARPERSSAARI